MTLTFNNQCTTGEKTINTLSIFRKCFTSTIVCVLGANLFAAANDYKTETVLSGLRKPVKYISAGNQAYIVEQTGKIRTVSNGKLNAEPFLDIGERVYSSSSETGLLGLAFHPEFLKNGRFFVNYTAKPAGKLETRISEFVAEQDGSVDKNKEIILLTFKQPYENHNGGDVLFGTDGYLYIGTGDGGAANDPQNNSQNLNSFLGKILRIDINRKGDQPLVKKYAIPSDNPYSGSSNGLPEIFAYGIRNPWGMYFDSKLNDLWVADVGQNTLEEINIVKLGGNYGWRIMEGTNCFNPNPCNRENLKAPVWTYPREEGYSVTGGFVYRGTKFPELYGLYIYGDYGTGNIWALKAGSKDNAPENKLLVASSLNPSAFAHGADGEILIVDHNGTVSRLLRTR